MNDSGPVLKLCDSVLSSVDGGLLCYVRNSQAGICGLEEGRCMSVRDSLALLAPSLTSIYHVS